jgi:glycosyltransferase involved in cell wall biosynthesis
MRILRCIASINPADGGPIEGIRQMMPLLEARGHQVDLVCLDDPQAPWVKESPSRVYALGPGKTSFGYAPKLVPWLREHAAEYDAVIVHGLWQYHGFAVWRALHQTAIPYFVYPHGMLDPWFKHTYPLKHLKKWLYWPWGEYRVLRDAQAVLFTCEEARQRARKSFWLYRCHEEVVSYGTASPPGDATTQAAKFLEQFPELQGKRLLLFLSRLHVKKGCDLLIRAFGKLLSDFSVSESQLSAFHLVLAGPCADPAYLAELKALAATCCPPGTVSFPGMLSGDLKWGAFHAAEAFVLPSHQENFGIAVAEAMACGLPTLISDKVNIWREILSDEAGLCAPDTEEGVGQLLHQYFSLPADAQKSLGERAAKCFQQRFHIAKAMESLLSVLARSGVSPPPASAAQEQRSQRILHLIRSVNPVGGGPIEAVYQLAQAHQDMGHQVTIAALDGPENDWLKRTPFPVLALGPGAGGYGYVKSLVEWLRTRRKDYDAVISHGLWQYNNRGVWEALRGTDTRYFVYPHGMLDPWFKGAYPLKHFKKMLYWRMTEHKVLREAAGVLFTCAEECQLARQTFRPYAVREKVVYLGIGEPEGDPEAQKEAFFTSFPEYRGKRLLLFLGRLHPKKGCDLLIRAFGKLLSDFSVSKSQLSAFHLVLAGPCADPAYLAELKALAATCCPPGTVSFPGMLSGDLKWGAFHAAEAFILPSHQENFGIAVAEAMACGLPVLISNKVNIWREIEEDGAGLVEDDTQTGTDSLLTRYCALTADEQASMRAKSIQSFHRRFQIQKAAQALLEVIQSTAK